MTTEQQSCQRCGEMTSFFIQVMPLATKITQLWCLGCVYRVGKSERECQIEEAKEWAKCYD